jgi:hypothetical protein
MAFNRNYGKRRKRAAESDLLQPRIVVSRQGGPLRKPSEIDEDTFEDVSYEESLEGVGQADDDIEEFGGKALPYATPDSGSHPVSSSSSSTSLQSRAIQPSYLTSSPPMRHVDNPPTKAEINLLAGLSSGPYQQIVGAHELKHNDFGPADVSGVTTAGTWGFIGGITVSALSTGRIGNVVKWHNIQLRGSVWPTDEESWDSFRADFYVVYDKQANGAGPTTALFLESANAVCMTKWDNRERFVPVIHRSWAFGMSKPVGLDQSYISSPSMYNFDMWKSLEGYTTVYKGVSDAIADCASGSFHYFFITSGPQCTWELCTRMVYNE